MANLLDLTTQKWVRITGKKLSLDKEPWLKSPIGNDDIIGDSYIQNLIKEQGLSKKENQDDFGLIDDWSQFNLSQDEWKKLNPKVKDFYQHTAKYSMEVWSEWCGVFKPFGILLQRLFSRRLRQLNLPTSSLDFSRGMESNIIKLFKNGQPVHTIWYRKINASQEVIYSGVYKPIQKENQGFLKVTFPLPNGNAQVLMRKEVLDGGALLLSSDGKKFGESGFYFTLRNQRGNWWVKHVKSMHEWIKVFEDEKGILRAEHILHFHGAKFLELHYKMTPISPLNQGI